MSEHEHTPDGDDCVICGPFPRKPMSEPEERMSDTPKCPDCGDTRGTNIFCLACGSEAPAGLDFEAAREAALKHHEFNAVFRANLDAQNAALLAAAVAQARREEREKVIVDAAWAASEETERIVRAKYAPLVAAVAEYQDARAAYNANVFTRDGEGHVRLRRLAKAGDALAALPLSSVTP